MDLKKVKDSKEAAKIVDNLFKSMDKVTDEALNDRAQKLDEYRSNLRKLIEDGLTSEQDLITTIEEVVDPETKKDLEYNLSEAMDWPESLDDHIWDYITHTSEEGDVSKAVDVVLNSDSLSDEDKVIVVDEIVSAYE